MADSASLPSTSLCDRRIPADQTQRHTLPTTPPLRRMQSVGHTVASSASAMSLPAGSGLNVSVAPSVPAESSGGASLTLSADERRLFCTHSVASLKQLAEDKRNASDDKKEELRQLVGIRYRVLIETADSIMSMQSIVDETQSRLLQLHECLPHIALAQSDVSAAASGKPLTQMHLLLLLRSYALASTTVWNAVDAHDFEAALALLLRMRGVRAQLESVEFWPLDSAANHPELQRLLDTALASVNGSSTAAASAGGSNSSSIVPALGAFFRHHASYHAELPNLVAQTAFSRLVDHSSLASKSYADCLTTLALLLRPDSPAPQGQRLGVQLLDVFLESKRKQLHALVFSAEHALTSFHEQHAATASSSTRTPPPNPTPILVHVCQQLLFTLQYTLLDVSLLFASIHPSANPHAKLVSSSTSLQQAWKQCNVAERVRAFWSRAEDVAGAGAAADPARAAQANAAAAAVTIDSALLSQRVATWLHSMQSFLSDALLNRLLPFLLPTGGSNGRSRSRRNADATGSCQSLQRLREEILRAANFELERSVAREGARAEDEAEERREQLQQRARQSEQEERRLAALQKAKFGNGIEGGEGGHADDADEDHASTTLLSKQHSMDRQKSEEQSLSPAEQARLRRKRVLERWDEACTLLFGQQSSGMLAGGVFTPAPAAASASPLAFAAPFSLFDFAFFAPLSAFTNTLVGRAFERLTLLDRMEKYLRPKAQLGATAATDAATGASEEKSSATGGKPRGKPQLQKDESKEKVDDEFDLSSLRKGAASASAPGAHATAAPTTDLNGHRESEVQEIVLIFRRQLHKLGKECRSILACSYVQPQPAAAATAATARFGRESAPVPIVFPALARYLRDDLAPQLTRKYNQLVEKLVEQLKKKLADLERSVLLSMSDVVQWRSAVTLELVEQSVFIGRVCHELAKQKQLMSLDTLLATSAAPTPRSSAVAVAPIGGSVGSQQIHGALSTTAKTAFRIWTRYIAAVLSEDFAQALSEWIGAQRTAQQQGPKHADLYFQQLFSTKNPHGGAALGLRLPVHASPSIFQLLFQLHQHYYRLLGFHVHSSILVWLLSDVSLALLAVFESKIIGASADATAKVAGVESIGGGGGSGGERALEQLSSDAMLQLLFDVQFLFAVMRLPPSAAATKAPTPRLQLDLNGTTTAAGGLDARGRYAQLLSAFESRCSSELDQIDWMSSRAAFAANHHAAVQRSAMLFGLLCKSNPFPAVTTTIGGAAPSTPGALSYDGAAAGGVSTAAQPAASINILPLAAPITRILPLSASLYPSRHPQPVAPPKPAAALPLSSYGSLTSSSSTAAAAAAAASSHTLAPPAAASAAGTATSASPSTGGLSFSNIGAQLALANSAASVNAKAIGDLGTSLLGKLSASSLWGTKKQ